MIEVIARGPVTVGHDTRIDKYSGHDRILGRSTVAETVDVEVHLEFPQGYVNLEGYAPSYPHGFPIREIFGSYVDIGGGRVEYQNDEWTVSMRGDWWDWVQQAHRYLTERPDKTLVSCLETFNAWEETDGDAIQEAMLHVETRTEYGMKLMGEMSDGEWDGLRAELNGLHDGIDIPESYSN